MFKAKILKIISENILKQKNEGYQMIMEPLNVFS